jgi:hypothetical protein
LFERLAIKQQHPDLKEPSNDIILIVCYTGDVDSILVQLENALTGATGIVTAYR